MEKFITASKSSKTALNMMTVSSSLPVNILVFGEEGVGKKRLIFSTFPETSSYNAVQLEVLFREKKVDFTDESEIVVHHIDQAGNVRQLIEQLQEQDLRIIATASEKKEVFDEKFLVKIDITPLRERPEDTQILVQDYVQKAKDLFRIDKEVDLSLIDINLRNNSISLKESIYRSILLASIEKEQMMRVLEGFLTREIEEKTDYKDLLEIFEIPLLKAMQKRYKSQLQMANKLNINRNTLRKKMNQYDLGEA